MKTDDFEKRLQRQAPRQLPASWREEIISASQAACQSPAGSVRSTHATITHLVFSLWRELICPARRIWAGLAAAWVIILIANANLTTDRPMAHAESATSSAELWFSFREQTLLVAELSGTVESKPIKPPQATPPRPRSQGINLFMTV
jgi:hypothetical protein